MSMPFTTRNKIITTETFEGKYGLRNGRDFTRQVQRTSQLFYGVDKGYILNFNCLSIYGGESISNNLII